MRFRQPRLLVPAVALALGLVACGSASDEAGPPAQATETTEAPPQAETTEAPEATGTTEAPPETKTTEAPPETLTRDGLTRPGTRLALGQWAFVPFTYGTDDPGVLKVRVTGIDSGTEQDRAALDEDTEDSLVGYSPRYVRIEAKQTSGPSLEYAPMRGAFKPITSTGEFAREAHPPMSFTACVDDGLPSDFRRGSGTADACVIALVPGGGDEVVGATFSLIDTPYETYGGKPITWR